jgi:hypothetical protein
MAPGASPGTPTHRWADQPTVRHQAPRLGPLPLRLLGPEVLTTLLRSTPSWVQQTHDQPSGLVWHQDQLPASAWLEDPAVRDRRLTQGQLLANHRRQGTAAQLGRHRRERACRLRL